MSVQVEPGVTATEMDDGSLVVLSERTGKLYRCTPSARAMWVALIESQGNRDTAATAVAEQFHAPCALISAPSSTRSLDWLW